MHDGIAWRPGAIIETYQLSVGAIRQFEITGISAMHCPSCGSVLSRQMKFCTRCGAQTNQQEIDKTEERFDEYLDGLFWTAVFGLGIILGGAVLLKIVLQFSRGLVIGYIVMSSIVFLTVFGLTLRETLRLARILKETRGESLLEPRDTNKMLQAEGTIPAELAQSGASSITPGITENTTRSLDPIPK